MGIYSHFLSLPVPTGSGERLASPKAMPGALSHVLEKPLHLAEKKKKNTKISFPAHLVYCGDVAKECLLIAQPL